MFRARERALLQVSTVLLALLLVKPSTDGLLAAAHADMDEPAATEYEGMSESELVAEWERLYAEERRVAASSSLAQKAAHDAHFAAYRTCCGASASIDGETSDVLSEGRTQNACERSAFAEVYCTLRWALSHLGTAVAYPFQALFVDPFDLSGERSHLYAPPLPASVQKQSFQVIGAGLGKTGTGSLARALHMLGYRVNHFAEHSNHASFWHELFYADENTPPTDWSLVTSTANAFVDEPACFFAPQLAEANPDAKVILTVRDSPEVWLKSKVRHLEDLNMSSLLRTVLSLVSPAFDRMHRVAIDIDTVVYGREDPFQVTEDDVERIRAKYIQHNQQIIETISAERLLVFNVKDGWEPLCEFLGEPVPTVPYPHSHRSGEIADMIHDLIVKQLVRMIAPLLTLLTLTALMIYLVVRLCFADTISDSEEEDDQVARINSKKKKN